MTTMTYAGHEVLVDAEGFLADPREWSEAMAVEIARGAGIDPMTERHWQVVRFMRQEWETKGEAPNVRALAKMSGVSIKELYELFPKGPAKLAARIAGVPKPHGCI